MNLEKIIRPFVPIGTTPAIVDPGIVSPTPVQNVVLSVGDGSIAKTFSGSFSSSETRYMDAKKKEKAKSPSRETHDKKIYLNNDPTSGFFITVRIVDSIWLLGPNGQYEQWTFVDPNADAPPP